MTKERFYTPTEVRSLYDDIIPAYQAAFADEPWNEVSKCIDVRQRCIGGLSNVAIGSICGTCALQPTRPAYESDELVRRFDALGTSRPTAWYTEDTTDGLAVAAVAWQGNARMIATEKYTDVPLMTDWLDQQFDGQSIAWLDEVFANRQVRPRGNLRNFGSFVTGLANRLDSPLVAYRTIAPQMTEAALRDFGSDAQVLRRNDEVPDRRDFVIITINSQEGAV